MTYTLITGACGVLGGAFVKCLAERSEALCLTGRSEERLQALHKKLKAEYPALEVVFCPCDLTEERSRKAFFEWCDEKGIRFHRLIYVAGVDTQKGFKQYTEEKIILQTRANFEGAVSFTRGVIERADLNGKTEFLAIGSVSGIYPMPYFALYSSTKKALCQFYSALRTELRKRAKVTCVQLGAIPTREDVKAYIKTQGLWGKLAALPPEKAAKKSLKAVKRNRRAPVIGFWNKLMRVCTAWVPLSWKLHFIAKKWKKTQKDAF